MQQMTNHRPLAELDLLDDFLSLGKITGTDVEDIAIANKAFRLMELQKMYEDSGKNNHRNRLCM